MTNSIIALAFGAGILVAAVMGVYYLVKHLIAYYAQLKKDTNKE